MVQDAWDVRIGRVVEELEVMINKFKWIYLLFRKNQLPLARVLEQNNILYIFHLPETEKSSRTLNVNLINYWNNDVSNYSSQESFKLKVGQFSFQQREYKSWNIKRNGNGGKFYSIINAL